ncbi:hypothetical protein J3R30DRAFT_3700851 [Lentinula aciculospora]|uniref:Uncharacterized protein n=1 Tax=Lentinula aciculospora TaxID=153920 RepID=A0A9W9AF03_9AGAR|nr:hypothetical protein J3R30DRAFT_3700851 [Lentinula aciculospora]
MNPTFRTTGGATSLHPHNQGDLFEYNPPHPAVTATQQSTTTSVVSWPKNVGYQNDLGNVRASHQEPRGDMHCIVGEPAAVFSENTEAIRSGSQDSVGQCKTTASSPPPMLYYIRKAQERIKAQQPLRRARPEDYESSFRGVSDLEARKTTSTGIVPGKLHKSCEIDRTGWPPRAPSSSSLPDPSDIFRHSEDGKSDDEEKSNVDDFFQSRGSPTASRGVPSSFFESSYRYEEPAIGPKLDIMSSDLMEFLEHEHASLLRRQREHISGRFSEVAVAGSRYEVRRQDTTHYACEVSKGIDTLTLENTLTAERPRQRRTKSLDSVDAHTTVEVKCLRPVRAISFQSVEGQLLRCWL